MGPVVWINTWAVVCDTYSVSDDVEADLPFVDLLEPIHRVVNQVDENGLNSMAEICDLQFLEG